MKSEFKGTILEVRAIEDSIRATRKYTKGAFSRAAVHPQFPIQGGEFPSRLLTEYYEVYPDMDLSWDMPASNAWAWIWGDTTHIDVRFQYDYRQDAAKVIIFGGRNAVSELVSGIPGFAVALHGVREECEKQEVNAGLKAGCPSQVVDRSARVGSRPITHP